MNERLALALFVLLSSNFGPHFRYLCTRLLDYYDNQLHDAITAPGNKLGPILLAEAKGVAGLGKAGGEGQGGADKAGQQVPPEVYMALTYAGTLFLFTLSVPLILYGLNKLLNKIEDCFGCGPSAAARRAKTKLSADDPQHRHQSQTTNSGGIGRVGQRANEGHNHQQALNSISAALDQVQSIKNNNQNYPDHPGGAKQIHQNQRLHLQMLQQYPKYSQFISMSSPDYNGDSYTSNQQQQQLHEEKQAILDHPERVPSHLAMPFASHLDTSSPPSRQTSANSCNLNLDHQQHNSLANQSDPKMKS